MRRGSNRFDGAREFGQKPVARGLYDTPPVLGDRRLGGPGQERGKACMGGLLVVMHEPGITGHVGGHYRRQPASDPVWLLLRHARNPRLPQVYAKLGRAANLLRVGYETGGDAATFDSVGGAKRICRHGRALPAVEGRTENLPAQTDEFDPRLLSASEKISRSACGLLPRISLTRISGRLVGQRGWSDPARVVRNSPRAGPLRWSRFAFESVRKQFIAKGSID